MIEFQRWSEWRKWDLHVHTPSSIINGYGGDTVEAWKQYINELENLPKEYSVLWINDYFFLDGYKRLLEEKKKGRLKNIDLLLPVIEFRIDKFAGIDFKKLKRINLHVIFSNEVDVSIIESQFLNPLQASYTLDKDWKKREMNITKETLCELGKEIKKTIPVQKLDNYSSDLEEWFNNLNISDKEINKALKKSCFQGKYLIAIGKTEWDALSWSDNSIATKKTIINDADIIFTASSSPETFKNAKEKLHQQHVKDLLLDCSDAHYFSSSPEKDRIGNSYTWIKADPTFEGLKQITYEPERIFIGNDNPLSQRERIASWKFIDKIIINKASGSQEKWRFNNTEIIFNKELVVIIWNKGSGKSAISDTLGLLWNSSLGITASQRDDNFSFLTKDKFLKKSLWKEFEGNIFWWDWNNVIKNLFDTIDPTKVEKVKYLPQCYFENICNDIEKKKFENELNSVIFNNLDISSKLWKSTFEELITFQSDQIGASIVWIKEEIKKINEQIIELEQKATPEYKKWVENHLQEKNNELKNLKKPNRVNQPSKTIANKNIRISKKIEKITKDLQDINEKIERKNIEKSRLELQKLEIDKFIYHYNEEKKVIEDINTKAKALGEIHNINLYPLIVTHEEKISKLQKAKDKINIKIKAMNIVLNKNYNIWENDNTNLFYKQSILIEELNKLKNNLDKQEKEWQDYQENYRKWEQTQKEIIGDKDISNTILWYREILKFLNNDINKEIKQKREERLDKVLEIYKKKKEIISIYKNLSMPIEKIIKDYENYFNEYNYNISVEVWFKLQNFKDTFLEFIDKSRIGEFSSLEGAVQKIDNILENDINTEQWFKTILVNIISSLEKDDKFIHNQVKKWKTKDFYDYIFSLEYLKPEYQLKLDDKLLEQLSPWEKGSLLLLFYLMLDTEDIPLIIDQPEDNLDNETVSTMLVPFIKTAKKKRQIIMVTHNPNLAVVADSEQVIFVKIDKQNNNTFEVQSWSIENDIINREIVKILEWTKRAFDKRKLRYFD